MLGSFAVIIAGQVASDGRADWLRGVQLLAVYLILATIFIWWFWEVTRLF